MSALPTHLLESPLLVDVHDAIDDVLVREKAARAAFRAQALEYDAEFINGKVVSRSGSVVEADPDHMVGEWPEVMRRDFGDLLDSPRLPDILDQINQVLSNEKSARDQFRANADGVNAEFINGEVVPKMATRKVHLEITARLLMLARTWVSRRRLGTVCVEQALTQFPRNDYCPDLCFWKPDRLPLKANPEQFVFPPPNLVVEVLSPSTEKTDRVVKFRDYEAHGVEEYWIVVPDSMSIEQYVNVDGAFVRREPAVDGILRCEVLPGFNFPIQSLFDDELCDNAVDQLR